MTDLIKQVGGIERARDIVNGAPENINYRFYSLNVGNGNSGWHVDFRNDCVDMDELRQAIADYNTDHCGDIINHVSPSTQVYEK